MRQLLAHSNFYYSFPGAAALALLFASACLSVSLPAAGTDQEQNPASTEPAASTEEGDWTATSSDGTSAQASGNPTSSGIADLSSLSTQTATSQSLEHSLSSDTSVSDTVSSANETSHASASTTSDTGTSSEQASTSDSSSGTPTFAVSLARIVVETTSLGGKYAPRNAGVVWVETAQGNYVDTLKLWAKIRRRHLVAWKAEFPGDLGDAISGATEVDHLTHEVTWDLCDQAGQPLAEGDYRLRGEFTEDDSEADDVADGATFDLPFHLTRTEAQSLEQRDAPGFARIKLGIE